MTNETDRLNAGNAYFLAHGDTAKRIETAEHGQHPYAIVICCSDSRVIPEQIFSAGIGDLFVIRIAGNVLDRHQLGSVEYAAAHLGCKLVVLLGHTGCGAVGAALAGEAEGHIADLVTEIRQAIGDERDPLLAAKRNVLHGVERLQRAFSTHPKHVPHSEFQRAPSGDARLHDPRRDLRHRLRRGRMAVNTVS